MSQLNDMSQVVLLQSELGRLFFEQWLRSEFGKIFEFVAQIRNLKGFLMWVTNKSSIVQLMCWCRPPVAKCCDLICTTCVTRCGISVGIASESCVTACVSISWLVSVQQGFLWLSCPCLIPRGLTDWAFHSLLSPFHVQLLESMARREHVFLGGAALMKCLKSCYHTICDYTCIVAVGMCKSASVVFRKCEFCLILMHTCLFSQVVLFRI